jgi:hypothetical protein
MVKKIHLGSRKYPGHYALVDDEDHEYLSFFRWGVTRKKRLYYAFDNQNGFMHRMIAFVGMGIDFKKGKVVDHINGNPLDNRRCNLRLVTHRQNCQNRHHQRTSKYPGVSWDTQNKRWIVAIQVNGKVKHLGRFENENEAFSVYKKAVHELTGEKLVCELGAEE